MSKYIGGSNLSQNEREPYVRKLRTAPVVLVGWPWQCRCGEMRVVKYRGRHYCQHCGFRWLCNPRTGEAL